MAVNAFTRRIGIASGRIQPTGAAAVLGTHVFCFGSDVAGDVQKIVTGDGMMIVQTADVTGLKLVRFRAKMRPPSGLPAQYLDTADGTFHTGSLRWFFKWGINLTTHGQREIKPGRLLDIQDGAIDVSQLVGNQDIKFILQAV